MPNRILIANRGEIALRILRACQQLGKETVAIYTTVDANLPHLDLATDTVCVSDYLSADDIVMAGLTRGCDAVHPGYGLLSENAGFAMQVEAAGMVFIGPEPRHVADLGDKTAARKIFSDMGIAGIPGSIGAAASIVEAQAVAVTIGYPVIVKAAFGGGGRGMRKVDCEAELSNAFEMAIAEAEIGFGRGEVFIEKFLPTARHIEVQILGDGRGGCVHLGTRDCSIQRRYQKLIEESPAPEIATGLLEDITQKCVKAMAQLEYRNAATMEFLYADDKFYFLEVNTRLQVEHPVTEMVSGIDLVSAQLQIADSGVLPFGQDSIRLNGHAIECRVLAEDSAGRAGPGEIKGLRLPGGPGIRFDSHIYVGYRVPHQYDSLIAKLVAHAENRTTALARLEQALGELQIQGVPTNIERLKLLVRDPTFANVKFHTNWNP